MNNLKVVGSTDFAYYTAMYRKKGSRRFYRCGYRSRDLGEMRDFVRSELRSGKYAAAKIVRWDDEGLIEKINKGDVAQ